MALEDINISDYSNNGTGPCILYYLETDPFRKEMVGL